MFPRGRVVAIATLFAGGLSGMAALAADPSLSAVPSTLASPVRVESVTFYVAPNGNDAWSGKLPDPNGANTDGPFATFDHARAAVQSLNKTGLNHVTVQFRGGTYELSKTVNFTAADSGSATTEIVYENYPRETPVISGGVRVQNWTNVSGNKWQTTLPASTQYFENLFYNGARRLRPRLGGYLGTYYRFAGPVYATSQQTNCPVQISSTQRGMLRPLRVRPLRSHLRHLEESRRARLQPVQSGCG